MGEDVSLKSKVSSGILWKLLERGGMQIVSFVVQIILARLLSPNDYGILTIVSVFISFSNTLINNGLGNAIIQKQNATDVDFNTVFYIQFGISVVCYIVLFFLAPFVSKYYGNQDLTIYIRVMSLSLFIGALSAIQLTALKKGLQFKKSFLANIFGVIAQGTSGIVLALLGCGVWSLIISQLLMQFVILITLLITVHWRPKLLFSFQSFKDLFSYSWKLFVAWTIGTMHTQVYSLVIGKCFSTEVLGYYSRGQNLPQTMTTTINETIPAVMFPALSTVQSDKYKFKEYTRMMMRFSCFAVCPIMAGIAGISENFVYVILTEKWAPCINMMQLFCISYGINIISTTNMQAFNALGRSDIFLKLEMIKRSVSVILLIIAAQFSIYLVIMALVLMAFFSLTYNAFTNKRVLNYTFGEQLKDMLPSMIISVAMFLVVILVNFIPIPRIALLVLQCIVGIIAYLIFSYLFNKNNFMIFLDLIKQRRGK